MAVDKQLKEEVKHFTGFNTHAAIYILVIGTMWILWVLTSNTIFYTWLLLPTLVWGLILAIHWYVVFREINKDQRS
jgi:hypothetical protein